MSNFLLFFNENRLSLGFRRKPNKKVTSCAGVRAQLINGVSLQDRVTDGNDVTYSFNKRESKCRNGTICMYFEGLKPPASN